ncbi:MAG: dUTP diphosphatase [Gemmatimonadetes bacterium]|nr:dUTP diphosphatase [Gemmatimonadota bacterium]
MREEVRFRRVRPGGDLPAPAAATSGAAGVDLRADLEAPVVLVPGGFMRVPTGLSVALPRGFEGQVRPRSGLAARFGVTVLNAPGTVDSDYRGEIQVVLINHGPEPYEITRGMRIAQLVVAPVMRIDWREVEELDGTPRGGGGFGSTGV